MINIASAVNHWSTKKPPGLGVAFEFGSACWARTSDPMINSPARIVGRGKNTLRINELQRVAKSTILGVLVTKCAQSVLEHYLLALSCIAAAKRL